MQAWIFDIDGVLTSPITKTVPTKRIYSLLIGLLRQGDVVGFNTGRSFSFVKDNLLDPLHDYSTDSGLIDGIITVAEKGGVVNTARKEDERIALKDALPQPLLKQIQKIIDKPQYQQAMFVDTTKQTMITIEMSNNMSSMQSIRDTYASLQQEAMKEISDTLVALKLSDKYKIDATRIAIDVENLHVGKGYGVKIITDIWESGGLKIDKYTCFGDSPSDLEMLTELISQKKDSQLVYVGDQQDLIHTNQRSIIFPQGKFVQGTLEYFDSL